MGDLGSCANAGVILNLPASIPGSLSRTARWRLIDRTCGSSTMQDGQIRTSGHAVIFSLCDGQSRVLDQGQPHAGPPDGDSRDPGGRDLAQPQMGPDEVVMEQAGDDQRRVRLLDAADRPQELGQRPVEPFVAVVVAAAAAALPEVDRPRVPAPPEDLSEGGRERLQAVSHKYQRNVPSVVRGRLQQAGGVVVHLLGRDIPGQDEPGGHIHHREHPVVGAHHPDELFVGGPLAARPDAQPARIPVDHPDIPVGPPLDGRPVDLQVHLLVQHQGDAPRGSPH